MEPHEIAAFIRYFNISSVTTLAFFAVFGVIRIVAGKSVLNIFRKRIFIEAFCVAALAAFALEATVFNFQHYLKYFADAEIATTEVSPEPPNRILTSEAGYSAEIVVEATDGGVPVSSGILFRNLNRRVTSIFTELNFIAGDVGEMRIQWTDEENTRVYVKKIYKNMPHENYAPLQPCGKVSELKVMFSGVEAATNMEVLQVVLNRQIPFYFSGLRLMVVSLLICAILVICDGKSRAIISRLLFDCKFDPASRRQNLVYALSVVLLILFSLACVSTSVKSASPGAPPDQYSHALVDALLSGKTHLEYGNPEKLLNAERPYDTKYLSANGYEQDVDWVWDWAWYKGKYYCYFGVVPAVILFVPYKMIIGDYLPTQVGVFIFVSITVILLAMLWRFCVKRYMPDMRFMFYLLAFMTLFFASGLYVHLRLPSVYTIVQSAGVMFTVAGTLLLLKSIKGEGGEDGRKLNRPTLFFACLCFALIAGCRPNMVLVSFIVPVVLWKHRSWKLLMFAMIPYIIVAIPLCLYNYVRFDSPFDFGADYNVTTYDLVASRLLNPIGVVMRLLVSAAQYLFIPNQYSLYFPFVEHLPRGPWVLLGSFMYSGTGSGLINFPIVFCLLYLFKNIFATDKPKTFGLLSACLIIAVTIMTIDSYVIGFVGRYLSDFALLIILPSLFCAYYWCAIKEQELGRGRQRIVYVLLAVCIVGGLLLFVTGSTIFAHNDPVLYRYLESSLGIMKVI